MTATSFWSADGRPMSAAQFLESLYGALPSFFKDEEELRQLWQDPMTRKQLLAGLEERGFDSIHLAEMQKLVDAEQCDLFDVLAYVAFAAGMKPRVARAEAAKAAVDGSVTDKQKAFINFVLEQYTSRGVGELDLDNLSPLLKLKYGGAISDALADLGRADQVRGLFAGFQQHLYGKSA